MALNCFLLELLNGIVIYSVAYSVGNRIGVRRERILADVGYLINDQ